MDKWVGRAVSIAILLSVGHVRAQAPADPHVPPGYGQQAQPQPAPQPQPYAQPYAQPVMVVPGPTPPPPRLIRVRYREGDPVPPGGQVVEQTRRGMWISGISVWASFWTLTVIAAPVVAAARDLDGEDPSAASLLYIPVVGPFLYLPEASATADPVLIMDGIFQATGMALFIAGLAAKQKFLVYYAEGPRGHPLALAPTGSGLALRF